jgi:hypothetical protein
VRDPHGVFDGDAVWQERQERQQQPRARIGDVSPRREEAENTAFAACRGHKPVEDFPVSLASSGDDRIVNGRIERSTIDSRE